MYKSVLKHQLEFLATYEECETDPTCLLPVRSRPGAKPESKTTSCNILLYRKIHVAKHDRYCNSYLKLDEAKASILSLF